MNDIITDHLPTDRGAGKSRHPGPWDGEPDKIQWTDDTTGLPCLIVRNRMGALCGYVGVAPDHPWHGKDYSGTYSEADEYVEGPDSKVDVHGGLTYAAKCHGDICHVTEEHDERWWFGFDCSHSFDLIPYMLDEGYPSALPESATYKDIAYVRAECARLAAQLVVVTP